MFGVSGSIGVGICGFAYSRLRNTSQELLQDASAMAPEVATEIRRLARAYKGVSYVAFLGAIESMGFFVAGFLLLTNFTSP